MFSLAHIHRGLLFFQKYLKPILLGITILLLSATYSLSISETEVRYWDLAIWGDTHSASDNTNFIYAEHPNLMISFLGPSRYRKAYYAYASAMDAEPNKIQDKELTFNGNIRILKKLADAEGIEESGYTIEITKPKSWILYLVAASRSIKHLEHINARIKPLVRLINRGASPHEGTLPAEAAIEPLGCSTNRETHICAYRF